MHLRDYLFYPLSLSQDKVPVNFDFACQIYLKIMGGHAKVSAIMQSVTDKATVRRICTVPVRCVRSTTHVHTVQFSTLTLTFVSVMYVCMTYIHLSLRFFVFLFSSWKIVFQIPYSVRYVVTRQESTVM